MSLDVRGKRTLEESLNFYVQGELMEGDNQYFCEDAQQKVCPFIGCWAMNEAVIEHCQFAGHEQTFWCHFGMVPEVRCIYGQATVVAAPVCLTLPLCAKPQPISKD